MNLGSEIITVFNSVCQTNTCSLSGQILYNVEIMIQLTLRTDYTGMTFFLC